MNVVLYEVYDQRAPAEPFDQLPLLDRTTVKKVAVESADKWGGVVLKMWCRVFPDVSQAREVVRYEEVYRYRAKVADLPADLDIRTLRRKLNMFGRRPKCSPRRLF
jgi:hypothetical protein